MMRKLVLLVMGATVGFLVAELALRAYHYPARPGGRFDTASPIKQSRWVGHPFVPFAGRPNADLVLETGVERRPERITTNSYGFRTNEFPAEKGPDDYVVLCFGGSTTYGYMAESNERTWPALLERMLAARYPDKNVRVFNLGVDMATTAVTVVNLALVGVHLRPDLVIVYHGFNDLAALGAENYRTDHAHFYRDLAPGPAWRSLQAITPDWLLRSYAVFHMTGAIDLLTGSNDLARAVGAPRVNASDRFKGIETMLQNLLSVRALATGVGAETLFSTFQFTYETGRPEYQELNATLRRFFEDNDLLYVDQAALIPDDDPTINVDDCHFTPKGRDMLTSNFFEVIVEHGLVR